MARKWGQENEEPDRRYARAARTVTALCLLRAYSKMTITSRRIRTHRRAAGSIFVYIETMSTAPESQPVSVEAYLDGELRAKHKHEYVNGVVYQMAGANNAHNQIATNSIVSLGPQLRGQPCQVFNSDTKVRVKRGRGTRFYYPDCLVTCNLNPSHDTFQDQPVVIIEVISESTRRTDEQEKREAYLSLPSLLVYLLVEQSSFSAVVYRLADGDFIREVYSGLSSIIPLPEIQCQLPLSELYESVVLTAVVKEDDESFSLQS